MIGRWFDARRNAYSRPWASSWLRWIRIIGQDIHSNPPEYLRDGILLANSAELSEAPDSRFG